MAIRFVQIYLFFLDMQIFRGFFAKKIVMMNADAQHLRGQTSGIVHPAIIAYSPRFAGSIFTMKT